MPRPVSVIAVAILALGASGVLADDRHGDRREHWPQREAQGHHRGPPPGRNDRPAREAQERNGGGRVLSVQPTEDGHRVKLLKNGEVRVYNVPDRERDRGDR
jgi:hypothetical protein